MIWCVEDDASIRDIEVYALRSTGFEACGFADGAAFWQALQTEEQPELVVLDVMLPGVDGMELLRSKYLAIISRSTARSPSPGSVVMRRISVCFTLSNQPSTISSSAMTFSANIVSCFT